MKKLILFSLLFVIITSGVFAGIKNIDQEKGIWQAQENKHIRFSEFKRIDFDYSNAPLKKVKRILLFNNNIFILDSQRSEIYVIGKKGNYIRTIGRPGQGPGDLEFAYDMFIASDGKIYVLNALPKRIAVFKQDGESLGTVKLDVPTDLMSPKAILVNEKQDFVIGGSFYHKVTLFSSSGDFVITLLKGEQKIDFSKPISYIGYDSKLGFIQGDILHFNPFMGVFTRISQAGQVKNVFGAYFQPASRMVKKFEQITAARASQVRGVESKILTLWSDFCIDNMNRIYVAPLPREKKEYLQLLFVFSKNGEFLYRKDLDYFKKTRINLIACDKESFVFLTNNFDLVLANQISEER